VGRWAQMISFVFDGFVSLSRRSLNFHSASWNGMSNAAQFTSLRAGVFTEQGTPIAAMLVRVCWAGFLLDALTRR